MSIFELEPIGTTFGVRVRGLDVRTLDDKSSAALIDALNQHQLLVIPGQHLDEEEQARLALWFGPLAEGDYGPRYSSKVIRIVHDADGGRRLDAEWHSDSMMWAAPPAVGIFQLMEGPEVGGDTVFVNMSAAYEAMSQPMRDFLRPLRAVHDVMVNAPRSGVIPPEMLPDLQREFPPVDHPVIRTHPVTGRQSIYVSTNTVTHIVGLRPDESEAILRLLYSQPARPEFQCRIHWEPGTIGIWDNHNLHHAAVYDYWPNRRMVQRVNVVGERPH